MQFACLQLMKLNHNIQTHHLHRWLGHSDSCLSFNSVMFPCPVALCAVLDLANNIIVVIPGTLLQDLCWSCTTFESMWSFKFQPLCPRRGESPATSPDLPFCLDSIPRRWPSPKSMHFLTATVRNHFFTHTHTHA
mmetsp:Transcript_38985/g.102995  ORF Transcript_38985/g.102995 Transcript_38985/m.102995 type:complete len:135 (-) Transcript_38985:62-466(-)